MKFWVGSLALTMLGAAGPVIGQTAPSPTPPKPTAVITNPDWKSKPSGDELSRVWPVEAARKGLSGSAKVLCYVTAEGLLDRCSVVSEKPTGVGFGAAALLLTRYFSMRPRTVDGQPVGGASIIIPMAFQNSGGPRDIPERVVVKVLSAPLWAEVPTRAELDAAFPQDEVGKIDAAHIVLRCAIRRSGDLYDCDAATEAPHRGDFLSAARRLAKSFKLDAASYGDAPYWEMQVDVPITLIAPGKAVGEEITDPVWVRSIDPTKAQQLFPTAAANAGIKTGRAIINCVVGHSGQLSDCHVVSENPSGQGFGDAAVSIATVMAMNPWTLQGRPVEGDRIGLPLVLKLAPTDEAPVAAPAP